MITTNVVYRAPMDQTMDMIERLFDGRPLNISLLVKATGSSLEEVGAHLNELARRRWIEVGRRGVAEADFPIFVTKVLRRAS